jgi:type I restriction enzyme S subunit
VTFDRVRVGEVLSLRRRAVTIDPLVEYTLIGVYSFGKGIFHRDSLPGAQLGDYRFFSVESGDLVLSNIQAWEGAIALARGSETGTVGTHRFLTYVPRDGRIDTAWARWFFLSEHGMDLIRRAAPGTTVRNRTLAIDRFEALEIPLPPIDEQRRIASRLDNLSATVTSMIEPRATGSESTLAALAAGGLHRAAHDLRAGSCELAPLGDLGNWSSGGTPNAKNPTYYDGGIPWAVIGDLNGGVVRDTVRTVSLLGIERSSAKLVPPGTVLVAMYGSIGKLGIAGVEMATNQAIACCQPAQEKVSTSFLVNYLRCIRPELVNLGKGGAQQNIGQGVLKSVLVPVPSADEQILFVSRVTQLLEHVEQLRTLMKRRRLLTLSVVPAALNESILSLD